MKPLVWMGSSLDDLRQFPASVRARIGYALWVAQQGDKHPAAKPLHGFGGAAVLEIASNFNRDTYRAVYTVGLPNAVYVLHAFQKKSRRGNATPGSEIELIRTRLL